MIIYVMKIKGKEKQKKGSLCHGADSKEIKKMDDNSLRLFVYRL